MGTTVGVPHVDISDLTYDVRDCPDSVSARDELYEERYIWEYEDVGNELELGGGDKDQEDYLQEDRYTDGEPGGVDGEDRDAYLQEGGEVGIRLNEEDQSDQQDALLENEEAEGEQGEYGDEQDEDGGSESGGDLDALLTCLGFFCTE